MKKLLSIIVLLLLSGQLFAQQQLLQSLQKSQADSTRLRVFNELSELYQKRRHGKNPADLDTAKIYLLKALTLSKYAQRNSNYERGWVLFKLGEVTLDQNNLAEGKIYFQQSIDFFHDKHDVENEAKALGKAGRYLCHPRYKDPQVAVYLSNAIELYTKLNNNDQVIQACFYTADDRYYNGKFDAAQKICVKLIEKYKNTRFHNFELVYYLMSIINRYEGNYDKALYYSLNGVRRMSFVNDTSQAKTLYGELAEVCQATGDVDHSIYYYKRCIAIR
jgi:tetratricopeptide (TPR) repeat protein